MATQVPAEYEPTLKASDDRSPHESMTDDASRSTSTHEHSVEGKSGGSGSPPPPGGESADPEDPEKVGVQIAAQLDEAGYHPVVILGTSNSGKSSLLGSLLAYFRQDAELEIGIYFGDPVLSPTTGYGEYVRKSAEEFFYRSIQEFMDGGGHQPTQARHPFFIPVIIRPKGRPEMRFAFLESNGEWYQPERNKGPFFRQLKSEVEGVLRHYQKGISVIYVAPLTQLNVRDGKTSSKVDATEVAEAGLALVGAMNAYESLRTAKGLDSHLLLVTKWDAYKKDGLDLKEVLTNTRSDVELFVNDKYSQTFAAFKGLSLAPTQRTLMQYCAALMSGRSIVRASDELRPVLYRYRRKLWNWLYKNASGYAVELIHEPPPPRMTLLERLHAMIGAILS